MPLKRFQERVLTDVDRFFSAVANEQARGNERHRSMDAWESLQKPIQYREHANGCGKEVPTVCIQVPTGGGKTLLATQILGILYRTVLKLRGGSGLVLWVVPSEQIYRDTLRALRDRRHFYRESLEHAVSRRVEVWEKNDIFRMTPTQLAGQLNVLLLQLASTNRVTKERLKFFRDTGGNIVQHFPPEYASDEHEALKKRIPNIDMVA